MLNARRIAVMLAALALLVFHHASPMTPGGDDAMAGGSGMPGMMLVAGVCLAVAARSVQSGMRRVLGERFAWPAWWASLFCAAAVSPRPCIRARERPPPRPGVLSLCVIRR